MASKRVLAFLAAPVLFLGGCQTMSELGDHTMATIGLGDDQPKSYTASAESEAHRTGIAVSDEPLAAHAGAAALASAGSAADAAAAMFFTLSATYPVAAGPGAGGICLVRSVQGQVSEYDFLTRAPAHGGAVALPGAVKGFHEMWKAYGALPWQRVVSPGEAYAATGFPISQALYARLVQSQGLLRQDAALAAEFLDGGGNVKAQGSETSNVALSQTLAAIRMNGADGFYKGPLAESLASYANAQGGALSTAELAATGVQLAAPQRRGSGDFVTYIPSNRTGAGIFTASMMTNLSRLMRGSRDMQGATAAAVSQSLAGFGVASLPRDLGSTGFAAVDANGQAVACAITLNGPFGAGRTAGPTGVQLAASPSGPGGLASAFLAPLIASNASGLAMTATGAGGPNGTAAAVYAMLEAAGGRQLGRRGDLRGTGNAPFDTVNVISCDADSCVALSDPGAHGLGAVAEATGN